MNKVYIIAVLYDYEAWDVALVRANSKPEAVRRWEDSECGICSIDQVKDRIIIKTVDELMKGQSVKAIGWNDIEMV